MDKGFIPTLLFHKVKSYFLVAIFGIVGGLLVVLFCEFPADTLWGFSYFSSTTIGFWMFTTSMIVLFSEKPIAASINACVYVYLMFFVTGIYKSFRHYYRVEDYGIYNGIFDMISESIADWFIYGLIPALVCAVLGAILWYGRKDTWLSKIILIAPAVVIVIEDISLYISVFTQHTKLFMALIDTACLIAYIIIFRKSIFIKPQDVFREKIKD